MAKRPDGSYDFGYYDTGNTSSYSHFADSQRKSAADAAAAAASAARRRREQDEADERRRRDMRLADDRRRMAADTALRRADEIARANARPAAYGIATRFFTPEQREHNLAISTWNKTTRPQRQRICAVVIDWLRREANDVANYYYCHTMIEYITKASETDRYNDGEKHAIHEILRCRALWKQPGTSNLLKGTLWQTGF